MIEELDGADQRQADQLDDARQAAAEEIAAQAELDAVIEVAPEEFVGAPCPDSLCCEYRWRFASGPWSCNSCHPRRSESA